MNFFVKEGWKKFFFQKTQIHRNKKTSANFRHNEVNCGKIQGQFVIPKQKTDITIQCQNWCQCLTILKLLKTQHCGLFCDPQDVSQHENRPPAHNQEKKIWNVMCMAKSLIFFMHTLNTEDKGVVYFCLITVTNFSDTYLTS